MKVLVEKPAPAVCFHSRLVPLVIGEYARLYGGEAPTREGLRGLTVLCMSIFGMQKEALLTGLWSVYEKARVSGLPIQPRPGFERALEAVWQRHLTLLDAIEASAKGEDPRPGRDDEESYRLYLSISHAFRFEEGERYRLAAIIAGFVDQSPHLRNRYHGVVAFEAICA